MADFIVCPIHDNSMSSEYATRPQPCIAVTNYLCKAGLLPAIKFPYAKGEFQNLSEKTELANTCSSEIDPHFPQKHIVILGQSLEGDMIQCGSKHDRNIKRLYATGARVYSRNQLETYFRQKAIYY